MNAATDEAPADVEQCAIALLATPPIRYLMVLSVWSEPHKDKDAFVAAVNRWIEENFDLGRRRAIRSKALFVLSDEAEAVGDRLTASDFRSMAIALGAGRFRMDECAAAFEGLAGNLEECGQKDRANLVTRAAKVLRGKTVKP